jgi:ABC-type phosphate transport system substrate-binding protein
MLVLLDGTEDNPQISAAGRLKGGRLVADPPGGDRPNPRTLRAFGFGGTAIASLVVLALVLGLHSAAPATGARCLPGSLTLSGSTAFAPTMSEIAARYQQACTAANVAVNPPAHPTGSHQGVLDLATSGRSDQGVRAGQAAMSDGPTTGFPELTQRPVAVVIFSVVVNNGIGVHSLTTRELAAIYSGQLTNWSQLHGPNLPILTVGRGVDSGTRSTFDQKVLDNTPEPAANSYNCRDRDQNLARSPVIRCEMPDTGTVLNQVNAIPGAIGYAEMTTTSSTRPTRFPQVQQIQLNGFDASPESVKSGGYPFWTIEYVYTYGAPDPSSLLAGFLAFLSTDAAKSTIQSDGHIPCTGDDGQPISLCR